MGIKKNALSRSIFMFCLAATIILYGSFMFYFCTANPTKAANIIYAAENDLTEGGVGSSKKEVGGLQKNDLSNQTVKQATVVGEETDKITKSQLPEKSNERNSENPDRYRCFLEFYIGQMVNFYQQIITILLGVIGVLLVISFMYLRFTSRQQAEDMANEALNSKSFQVTLKDMVKKEFAEAKKSDEFTQMYEQIPSLAERVDVLEKIVNTKADDEVSEEKQ
ncbi:MAG: hypothetical protein WC543_06060 [Candidatus Omnitrophota bacterium]